jgi:hypothetical protein
LNPIEVALVERDYLGAFLSARGGKQDIIHEGRRNASGSENAFPQDITIDGVRARPAPLIARADPLGCRYIVRARPTAGIDAVQQSAAVWELRRHFDVNDRPR